MTSLQYKLNTLENKYKPEEINGVIKVALYDLQTRETAHLRGDEYGWAASIIKVPVMNYVLDKATQGAMNLHDLLTVDHRLMLEPYDTISKLPQGSKVPVFECIDRMIVESDNEATNMLIEAAGGVEDFNEYMWHIKMNDSMLGHLLCPQVPRYTSDFNEDGSNITTPHDMINSLRQIYDPSFSSLTNVAQINAQTIMNHTQKRFLGNLTTKSKVGYIMCPEDGEDSHLIGIANDRVLFAIMNNKVGQKKTSQILPMLNSFEDLLLGGSFGRQLPIIPKIPHYSPHLAIGYVFGVISHHLFESK